MPHPPKYAESIASRNNVSRDNFIGQSLLGNDLATISQLALGPNRGDAALDTAFSNPTPVNAIALTAKGVIDQVAVDTGRLAVSSNGAGTYFATGSILKPIAQTGIGKAVGTALGILSAAKGVFDIALYFDALVACSQDPTLQ